MTFAQRRIRLTTHFSERLPADKRRVSVFFAASCNILSLSSDYYTSHIHCSSSVFKTSCEGQQKATSNFHHGYQHYNSTSYWLNEHCGQVNRLLCKLN